MLSKQGFLHHLNNIEEQGKWVQYYTGEHELQQVPQNSVDLSKEILTEFFDNPVHEIYVILGKLQPEIVDFTFYTSRDAAEKRVEVLNQLSRGNNFWYLTLYSHIKNSETLEKNG